MKVIEIRISQDLCKGCFLCVWACPYKVIDVGKERNYRGVNVPIVAKLEECRACRLCEYRCPDFAIQIITDKDVELLREAEQIELRWQRRVELAEEMEVSE
ncbi:ferredoxin family protein [Candidatus Methanodesulfokora washburnensis]|uniref:Ferredoxin family protein n=1 Tax=Candidatus Methanodesulfokora washburnensis TaxID=2478471 RepID=A0A429GCH6_9CREN|nr:ferredoxin family protein [Candidatus Methanodesulfokores washburnensis]